MIYIIGAGYMAREYAMVLKALNKKFAIIGRGDKAVNALKSELNVDVFSGGLTKFIKENNPIPQYAIVCTPVDSLSDITMELLAFGVKNILVEKPGALSINELCDVREVAKKKNAEVIIGYNRRFFQSTLALEKYLKHETLIASNFEITEWAHRISDDLSSVSVKEKWVLANTSHILDLVMHITGSFSDLASFSSGQLSWHPSSSRFVGSGISEKDVLISYCGYWDGPGRWSAEFITTENRYIFRPIEKLQVQKLGSISIEFDESIDYRLDEEFKPGLYLQTKEFLNGNYDKLCSLDEQIKSLGVYNRIANY